MLTEKDEIRIEVENDNKVVIIFPRRCNYYMMPWQDAEQLSIAMVKAYDDIRVKPLVCTNGYAIELESRKVKVNVDNREKQVVIFFDWNDRIEVSPEACKLIGLAIGVKAQDLRLLNTSKVRIIYDKFGHGLARWFGREQRVFKTR